jgi:rhamnogalacturonyl hydrolase YesR
VDHRGAHRFDEPDGENMLVDRRSLIVALAASAAAMPIRAQASNTVLSAWPKGMSPVEIGKRVAERFVRMPHGNADGVPPKGSIIYPEGCAWYGALTFAKLSGDTDLSHRLAARFEPLFSTESALLPTVQHVDPSMFGAVPLELYIETRDPRYLAIGKAIADRQWAPLSPERLAALTPDERAISAEAVAAHLSPQTRFWVDDMYMITILQLQAFRATGDPVYLDRAGREAVAYLDRLQQPIGLFFHAPDVPFYWGRGNGWFAVGMAELLRTLPAGDPHRAKILAHYRTMMATLLANQGEGGMWRQLIDRPESWPESSATAMFTFAMITGAKSGWLDGLYAQAARKGWLALCARLDANAEIPDVCEGTNKKNDYQYYIDRKRNTGDLHGQAPILWCASALLA